MTAKSAEVKLARSKAGHDKGRHFVVVREEEEYLYLADGISRTVGAPKKKNRKHVQIIKNIPGAVLDVFTPGEPLGDAEIKRALKLYNLTGEKQEEA